MSSGAGSVRGVRQCGNRHRPGRAGPRLPNVRQTAEGPMLDVASLLADPCRSWAPGPPGDEAAIRALQQSAPVELPSEYIDLLRHSDGGEGPLALPPLYFMLYSAEYAAELNAS